MSFELCQEKCVGCKIKHGVLCRQFAELLELQEENAELKAYIEKSNEVIKATLKKFDIIDSELKILVSERNTLKKALELACEHIGQLRCNSPTTAKLYAQKAKQDFLDWAIQQAKEEKDGK